MPAKAVEYCSSVRADPSSVGMLSKGCVSFIDFYLMLLSKLTKCPKNNGNN
jgi:hypothetical protein